MDGCESQTYPGYRTLFFGAISVVLVVALAGCGDTRLTRHFGNDVESTDAGYSNEDGSGPTTDEEEELQDWYDGQETIIAPWAHEFDLEIAGDARIEAERISWPLPEYDYMREYEVADILWAPVSDYDLAFARRILSISEDDDWIIFETREAQLDEIYIKASGADGETRDQPLSSSRMQSLEADGASIRTRTQRSSHNEPPFSKVIPASDGVIDLIPGSAPLSVKVCRPDESGAWTTTCSPDPFLEESGSEDDPNSSNWSGESAVEVSFIPEVIVSSRYVSLAYEGGVNAGDWDEDDYRCVCLVENYAKTYEEIYSTCGGIDESNLLDVKERCTGGWGTFDFKHNGGMEVRLRDFTVAVKGEVAWEKDLLDYLSAAIPCLNIPAGPLAIQVCPEVPLKVAFSGSGSISWQGEDSPSLTIPADFGWQTVERGSPNSEGLYTPDTPYNTQDTGMNMGMPILSGAVGGEVSLSILAKVAVKIAGSLGPNMKFGPYAKLYAELKGEYDTGTGEGSISCVLGVKAGGKVDLGLEFTIPYTSIGLDVGVEVLNTCDDIPAACFDESIEFCEDGTGEEIGKFVRLVPVHDDGGLNDPDGGLEIDAIHAIGDQLNQVASVIEGDIDSQKLVTADYEACEPSVWADKVGVLDPTKELIVELTQPIAAGDRLEIIRQDFSPSQGFDDGNGGVIQCQPSGAYDVYVGKREGSGNFVWGPKVASEVYNTTNWRLNASHVP